MRSCSQNLSQAYLQYIKIVATLTLRRQDASYEQPFSQIIQGFFV